MATDCFNTSPEVRAYSFMRLSPRHHKISNQTDIVLIYASFHTQEPRNVLILKVSVLRNPKIGKINPVAKFCRPNATFV